MDPNQKIYKSFFNLNFDKCDIEVDYLKYKNQLLLQRSKYSVGILLVLSLIADIDLSIFWGDQFGNRNFLGVTISSYLITIFYSIFLIFTICCKNLHFLKMLNYFTFFLITFVLVFMRYPIVHYKLNEEMLNYLFFAIDIVFRLIWVFMGNISYLESLGISLIDIALLFMWAGLSQTPENLKSAMIRNSAYSVTILLVGILAYLFEALNRRGYYYNHYIQKKNEWLMNVLENMNTGFISVKEGKIRYINKFLESKIENIKEFTDSFQQGEEAHILTSRSKFF
jgi:hypothetical protein